MSRLIGAELNRWFSRRLVWVVFAASVLLTLLVVAGTAYSARPMSSQELAYAEQQYTEMKQEAEREAQQCLRDGGTADECAPWTPERSDFVREPPPYAALAGGMAQAGTMIAAYAALLAGACRIDLQSGPLRVLAPCTVPLPAGAFALDPLFGEPGAPPGGRRFRVRRVAEPDVRCVDSTGSTAAGGGPRADRTTCGSSCGHTCAARKDRAPQYPPSTGCKKN